MRRLPNGLPYTRHPLFATWRGMLDRCSNEKSGSYADYGGRGVRVCVRWHDFPSFLIDMGEPPSHRHSLDRIDVDGHYEPGNVKWSTPSDQARNKRTSGVLPAVMRRTSEGQEMFRECFASGGYTLRGFGSLFGISSVSVHQWLRGSTRPEHHHRLALERVFGIPADTWMTDAEYLAAYARPRLTLLDRAG